MLTGSCPDWALKFAGTALAIFWLVSPGSAQTTLALTHTYSEGSQPYNALAQFADDVSRRSEGRLTIFLKRGGLSNREQVPVRAVQDGLLDMAVVQTSLSDDVGVFKIFDLPFVFRSNEHVKRVVNGPIFELGLRPMAQKVGVDVLGVIDGEFRQINSFKPLVRIEDYRQLRLGAVAGSRSLLSGKYELEPTSEYFSELGAQLITLPLGEVFDAAKAGYILAVDLSLRAILQSRSYEEFRFLTVTNHSYSPIFLIASSRRVEQLPVDSREILRQAARRVQEVALNKKDDVDRVAQLDVERRGVKIVPLSELERARFEERGQSLLYDRHTLEFDMRAVLSETLRISPRL
jgi:TRAP-type transport system periplasmic protein